MQRRLTRYGAILFGAGVIVTGLYLLLHAYLNSAGFQDRLTARIAEAAAVDIRFNNGLSIGSLIPRIELSAENVTLKSASLVQRARIRELHAAVSWKTVLSRGSSGALRVRAEQLTAIASPAAAADNIRGTSDSHPTEAPQLALEAMDKLSDWDIDILLRETDIILRNQTTGASHRWLAEDVSLVTSDVSVESHATVHTHNGEPRNLSATVDQIDVTADRASAHLSIDADTASQPALAQARLQILESGIRLDAVSIVHPSAQLTGHVSIDQNEDHKRVLEGEISLSALNIDALRRQRSSSTTATDARKRVFDYTPISWAIPEDLSGSIFINIDSPVPDSLLPAVGEGTLTVADQRAELVLPNLTMYGGAADVRLSIDSSITYQTGMSIRAELLDIDLSEVSLPVSRGAFINKGKLDVVLSLRGRGASPGLISSSMDGYLIAALDDAEFSPRYSTALDRGLVSWAVERLAITSRRRSSHETGARLSDPLAISCGSIRLHINDGKIEAKNGLVFELPDNSLYGSGFVDLHSEQLGFAFKTRRRSLFDFSAISIIKFSEISGTLGAPRVTLNQPELLKQGVLTASTMTWGPLPSVVYALAESGLRNGKLRECTPTINE